MGVDGVKVGVRTVKYVIIATRMCYRSVCNHPFVVGIILLLLFLYRSFPYLFAILVSSSPVLVCTAVLLGALLSFGDPNIVSESEEGENSSHEIVELKTGKVVNTVVVEEGGRFGKDSRYTELGREFVKAIDEEPLLENSDKFDKSGSDHDDNGIGFSSMSIDRNTCEAEKQWIAKAKSEQEITNIKQSLELGDSEFSHGEIFQAGFPAGEKVQAELLEDYISAEGSIDFQRDYIVSSLESQKQTDEDLAESLISAKNMEDYKSADGSVDVQMSDQLEPSMASWKRFDVLDDQFSAGQEVEEGRFLGYNPAEGSSEAQMRDYIESSLRSWEQMASDQDDDVESDSGSDGAESSSPDASMVDIIPMLDELHPLLDEENPQASKLSCQSSASTIERSAISPDSSIHSDDESDKKDEVDNGRSDADEDNEEGDQGVNNDPGKSVIMWTEDDQKNLMDLGTSELERNQRLESLIARRRARKMIGDGNLIDLDGMDLPFPVASISTKRNNPFDYPQDSYADLGLPPIPGSAPSIMLARRNPFDLPYDSSEEKPDLMGDSFQQEFMELTHREAFNQREALFRRNETFNLGSSGFDLGRPSRFRPYFVPERTDSDMMSYSSLQRQFSELSESKASSVAETELTYAGADQEEKKLLEHDSGLEVEPSEIDNISVVVEHGSQSFEDFGSLSGEEKDNKGYARSSVEAELCGAWSSHVADSEVMRNSSLQRNLSGHNESKTSSIAEEDSNSVGADREEKQVMEHVSTQEVEPCPEIDFEEQGSQSSEDLDSLSDEENKKKDFVHSVLEVELNRAKSAAAAPSFSSETVSSADNSLDNREIYLAAEPWLSHNKVSHSDIQLTTELIEVNNSTWSRPLSEPHVLTNEKSDDVNRYMLNRENNQVNNLVNVDIPENYSEGSSMSDVTTGLSLGTSEQIFAAQEEDKHPKEPIYDWSPLKPSHSLSSSSSDLQRETSGLDLYQLSRNLFVVEESYVHNQDLENISKHTNQDADSKGLIMNDIGEGRLLDSTDSFSELNQLPGNSQTLVLAEEECHLSIGSSDRESKDTVSYDKVSPHEVEHIMEKEDSADIHIENKLVNDRNVNNMPSAYRQEFMEDSVKDKNEAAVLVDNLSPVHSIFSSLEMEFEDKIEEEMIVDQQFQVSTSSLKNQENEENEMLLSPQDENQFLPHGTDIHDSWSDPAEQVQTIIQRELDEFDQINKVDEPVTVLMGQDPQQETLSDPGRSNVTSCKAEDSETASTSELAIKEHVQDILETRHACTLEENHEIYGGFEGSIAHEHILNEDQNDVNAMDEALLAKFNAVEVTGEVHTGTEMPTNHETSNGDSSPVVDFESEGKNTGTNLSRTTEMELGSHTGFSAELLDLEAQSLENNDYAFKIVNEEIQKSMAAESFLAEFPAKEIEFPFTRTEYISEFTEPGGCTSEATLKADAVFDSSESVPDIIQSDLALLEAHNLNSETRETVSGKPVLDAEVIKESGEDNEKVETESDESGTAEALQAVVETGDDPMESMPLQMERDIKQIEKSTLPEESTASVVGHSDGNIKDAQEFSALVASETLSLETEDGKDTLTVPVFDGVAPAVESENQVGRNTSEQLQLGKDSKEVQESLLVGVSIGSAPNSEHQLEKIDFVRSDALQIEEVKETQDFTSHEGSSTPASDYEHCTGKIGSPEPLQLDRDIHEIEESPAVRVNIPLVLESLEKKEWDSYGESEPFQSDKIVEELHDWHVVDGTGPIELEPSQTYTDIKETQKSPTAETSIPAPKSEDQILTVNSEGPELFPINRNVGELQELPAVEEKVTLAVESEVQLERVALVKPESVQMDRDKKETQESSARQTSYASAVEFRDQMESNSPMEDIEVQALHDHQLDSQKHSKVDVPKAGDS